MHARKSILRTAEMQFHTQANGFIDGNYSKDQILHLKVELHAAVIYSSKKLTVKVLDFRIHKIKTTQ